LIFKLPFELLGAAVAESGMFSDPVVVAFDVAEGFASSLFDGFEQAAVEQFGFDSGSPLSCPTLSFAA